MANEYAVSSADMKVVADAIRAKAGTEGGLVFPSGFADAIAAIMSGGAAESLAYDMGEWGIDTDTASAPGVISIPHNLGEVPDFVCVWTDHWAGVTEAPYSDKSTMVGWVWLRSITGMTGRASSTADMVNPVAFLMSLPANDYRLGCSAPTSVAYGIIDGRLPTKDAIFTPAYGAGAIWRAGVTYKYFVSKAWWNAGGGIDA